MAHLTLVAEIDALGEALKTWADRAPCWQPTDVCRALVRRLLDRSLSLRARLEAPLVVAMLGGTGVGKSALVNALVGDEVTATGRSRPTTAEPVLICRPEVTPELLGIDAGGVQLIQRDSPALADLVFIDCPDPDTTESADAPATNLARLRRILPHCDVILVVTTQQKYRSARVAEELAAAASGARLVFVQTHADTDQDIREDWRRSIEPQYAPGHIFFVDSLGAISDLQQSGQPHGEFAALVDLLTCQLVGAAATRIRRANFLDLVDETLAACDARVQESLPAVNRLDEILVEHRTRLAAKLAGQLQEELAASHGPWESRVLARIVTRWGFSPFALVLRVYQGLGGLASGALLLRMRTPAQMALWGAAEATRRWQVRRRGRQAETTAARTLAGCWDPAEIRSDALVIDGYVAEAGLNREAASADTILAEANDAGQGFAASVSTELETLIDRAAVRQTGLAARGFFEALLMAMLVLLLYRPAKNFFYDSWLAANTSPVYGLDFYLVSLLWFALWCVVLIWAFTGRMRRGLRAHIDTLAEHWRGPKPASGVFAQVERECLSARRFHRELNQLRHRVARLKGRLRSTDEFVGRRRDG
jgi:hypothetical protein